MLDYTMLDSFLLKINVKNKSRLLFCDDVGRDCEATAANCQQNSNTVDSSLCITSGIVKLAVLLFQVVFFTFHIK